MPFSRSAGVGMWARTRAVRRIGAVLGVIALMPASLAQAEVHVGGAVPSTRIWPGPAAQTTPSVPGHNATPAGKAATVTGQRADTARYKPAKVTFPSGSATASLAPAVKAASSHEAVNPGAAGRAGSLPVTVASVDGSASAAKSVAVHIATRAQASAAGINGVIVTLARADGGSAGSAAQVSLDYSGYAAAYGGGYADRLKLVELPACALTTPQLAKCRVQTPVKYSNDLQSGTLTATVQVAGGAASAESAGTAGAASPQTMTVLAQTSSSSGSVGTYSATSLSPAGSWAAGGSSGSFTYSYPITVPAAVGGVAPDVTLSYDSASVDGRTSATNSQASWIGDGWDYSPGFIERSYRSCSKDGIANSSDECWAGNMVSLSLAGHSGALVRDDASPHTWHLQGDDGTKVIALSGADNGAWQGEAWEIVIPDGTEYFFGENHLPGGSGADAATRSVFTEPVYCPKSGDGPTYLSGSPSCNTSSGAGSFVANMAWRWNLDYVVDPHGNLQTYSWVPETNYYLRGYDGGANAGTSTIYTRGGYLHSISYGYRLSDAIAGAKPLDTVTFTIGERCTPGWANCNYSYLTSNLSNSTITSNWPDTPADLICPSQTYTCANYSTSFFETDQLQSITTQVLVGSGYDTVDTYSLSQYFPSPQAGVVTDPSKSYDSPGNPGDGTVAVMWLGSITHTGNDMLGGASSTAPALTESFVPDLMPNRVDGTTTGFAALYRPRMDSITTESGAQIVVSYSTPQCTSTSHPTPDANTTNCFPQYWSPVSGSILDWFNTYQVVEVSVNDLVAPAGWSEAQVTRYAYQQPAWHRDDSPLTPNDQRTWSQFNGFRTVTTTAGVAGTQDVPTQSVTTYLQGMDGDYLADGTKRSVSIADTVGDTVTDSSWLQGQVLETDTLAGVGGAVVKKTVNGPWTYTATASEAMADSMPAEVARMLASAETRSYALWHDGLWKSTETDVTYDSSGRAVTSDAKGDGTSADPEVCTTTSYAASTSPDPNMLDYPDEVKAVQGACGTTASAANTVSDTRTFYDTSTTLGALTGAGDATETEDVDSYTSAGAAQYIPESQKAYDAYGRVVSSTDADTNTTTTAYTAPGASPDTVTVTNPAGWQSTSTIDPARNLPIASTDVNGELTSETYDSLGRLTAVWSPLHAKASGAPADDTFSYAESSTVPTAVTSEKLREDGSYAATVVVYDGSLRKIQSQAPTADGESGRLIMDTHYNSLGQTVKATQSYYNADSGPISTLFQVDSNGSNDSAVPMETETFYDGLGRTVKTLLVAQGVNQWSTVTAYKGTDETDVTPPQGGTATSSFVDVLGRTVQSWAYNTAAPTGNASDAAVTTYTYTPAGKPATMQDNAHNTWSWTYDLHGRQVVADDPGTGKTTSRYDAAGNLTSTTDARNITLTYSYDQLDRKTAEYNTTSAGVSDSDELASWTYDTLLKGQLTSTARYTNGKGDTAHTYTESVTGYTVVGQPTGESVTIPSGEGALAGTYSDSHTYTAETSLLDGTHYNPEGNLPKEQVNFGYNSVSGILMAFGGSQVYLNNAEYNPYGQILKTNFGVYGEQLTQNETYDVDSGQLLSTSDSLQTSTTGPIDDVNYTYDQAGLITSESNLQAGNTTPDTQCFTYDHQDRLTAAYTDTGTINTTTGSATAQIFGIGGCADTTPTAGKITGGPAPYAQTYSYDTLGDRVGQNQLNTTTAAVSTTQTLTYHGYDASTGVNTAASTPDAVQTITTVTPTGSATAAYGYTDGNGNTDTRTVTTTGTITAGPSQKITYDAENRTQTVTDTATGTTSSYLYDATGNLLIQRDPASNQTTLYLPYGEEIYLNTGNGALTGSRFINASPDGITIVHSSDGTISYELSDHLHTATTSIAASNLAVTNRYDDPYGNPRGTTPGSWPDQHAFLGQPQDQTTGLSLLGARQYDPTTGRFLTVDPVLETGDQRQMNGYSYAADNPVNSSDPTGLDPCQYGGCTGPPYPGYDGGPACVGQCGPDQQAKNLAALAQEQKEKAALAREKSALANFFIELKDCEASVSIECEQRALVCFKIMNGEMSVWDVWAEDFPGLALGLAGAGEEAMGRDGGARGSADDEDETGDDGSTATYLEKNFSRLIAHDAEINAFVTSAIELAGDQETQIDNNIQATQKAIACANSFAGDTPVLMADGTTKPIDKIKVGDKIQNAEPGAAPGSKDQTHTVEELHITYTDHDYTDVTVVAATVSLGGPLISSTLLGSSDILAAGGGTLTGTAHHLYYDATTRLWTEADQLRVGDQLQTTDGHAVTITALRDYAATMVTYNLTIDDLHTYYVLAGDTPVLVHNDPGGWTITPQRSTAVMRGGPFGAMYYQQPPDSTGTVYWWSPDQAGHGGSAWKVFTENSTGLQWYADADANGNFITGKWKGATGMSVPFKNLKSVNMKGIGSCL